MENPDFFAIVLASGGSESDVSVNILFLLIGVPMLETS